MLRRDLVLLALTLCFVGCETTHEVEVRIRRPMEGALRYEVLVAEGGECGTTPPTDAYARQSFVDGETAMALGDLRSGRNRFWVSVTEPSCTTCFSACRVVDVTETRSVLLEPTPTACSALDCGATLDGGMDGGIDGGRDGGGPDDADMRDVPELPDLGVDAPDADTPDAPDGGSPGGVTAVACGRHHTCAVHEGTTYCWGGGEDGELGNGARTAMQVLPAPVSIAIDAVQLSAGEEHTCARLRDGTISCWGRNHDGANDNFRVTDTSGEIVTDPVPLTGGAGFAEVRFVDLEMGFWHGCALSEAEQVYCWGVNTSNELAAGAIGADRPPGPAVPGVTAVSVAAGDGPSCAALTTGGVQCWGYNQMRMLGTDSGERAATPALVLDDADAPINAVAEVSSGGVEDFTPGDSEHAAQICARTSGGALYCWGRNDFGQTGNLSDTPPMVVRAHLALTSGVTAVATGGRHTCAVQSGAVRCVGDGAQGQLGQGAATARTVFVDVMGLPVGAIDAIDAGGEHTCAIVDGRLFCWGSDAFGQLGTDAASGMATSAVEVVFPDT